MSDLAISKTANVSNVELGRSNIIYDIVVENKGPHLASVANAEDFLGEELSNSVPVEVIMFVDIQRLGAGESIPITLEVVPIKGGVLTNKAKVTPVSGVDVRTNNNEASVEVLVSEPTDTAGNGIPDYWALVHSLTEPVDPQSDDDGDNLTLAQEYTLNSDPNVQNPNAADLLMDAIIQPNVAFTKLSFMSEVGRIYTLQRARNLTLQNWATVQKLGGNGGTITFCVPSLGVEEFCRLIVTVP